MNQVIIVSCLDSKKMANTTHYPHVKANDLQKDLHIELTT